MRGGELRARGPLMTEGRKGKGRTDGRSERMRRLAQTHEFGQFSTPRVALNHEDSRQMLSSQKCRKDGELRIRKYPQTPSNTARVP